MTNLSEEAQDLLLHVTGRRAIGKQPGRNSLVGPETPTIAELVAAGMLESRGFWEIAQTYAWAATTSGIECAVRLEAERNPPPKSAKERAKAAGRKRYDRWLTLKDVGYDCTFHEFLTSPCFASYR